MADKTAYEELRVRHLGGPLGDAGVRLVPLMPPEDRNAAILATIGATPGGRDAARAGAMSGLRGAPSRVLGTPVDGGSEIERVMRDPRNNAPPTPPSGPIDHAEHFGAAADRFRDWRGERRDARDARRTDRQNARDAAREDAVAALGYTGGASAFADELRRQRAEEAGLRGRPGAAAAAGLDDGYPLPPVVVRPGDGEGGAGDGHVTGGRSAQAGLSALMEGRQPDFDPAGPEAYDPETGLRGDDARKTSFLQRLFGSDKDPNLGRALLAAGAAMMGTNGHFGEALANAVQAGLTTYDDATQALKDEEKEARQMGMIEEAHELDMALKRLQLERRRAGPIKAVERSPVEQAFEDAASIVAVSGGMISEEEAMRMALGRQRFTSRSNDNPLAGLMD